MRTTFTTIFHDLLGYAACNQDEGLSPLSSLPFDGLLYIFDFLAPRDLAVLCLTSRAFRAAATRPLYANICLKTYGALYSLVTTLEASPRHGEAIFSFSESPTSPFLFNEPPPHLLTRALARMPNLRRLALRSPLDIATMEFAQALGGLTQLEELRLGDATPETLQAVLPYVRPLHAVSLRRATVGRGDAQCLLAEYFLRAQNALRRLDLDGALLDSVLEAEPTASFENVYDLRVHGICHSSLMFAFPNVRGVSGCISDQCDRCAPRFHQTPGTWDNSTVNKLQDETYPWGAMVWAFLGALVGWTFMF